MRKEGFLIWLLVKQIQTLYWTMLLLITGSYTTKYGNLTKCWSKFEEFFQKNYTFYRGVLAHRAAPGSCCNGKNERNGKHWWCEELFLVDCEYSQKNSVKFSTFLILEKNLFEITPQDPGSEWPVLNPSSVKIGKSHTNTLV